MGCCASEDDHHTANIGTRPKAKGAGADNNEPVAYNTQASISNENILDSMNEKVRTVYNQLGAFSIPDLNDGETVEKKGVYVIDNNSKYEGEWKNTDSGSQRHGKGV